MSKVASVPKHHGMKA